jgi:uncharacterized protein (DUF1499 family)
MNGLFARLALLAGLAAAVLVGGSGPAFRYGFAELPIAFGMMTYGVYAAMGAGALALLWLVFALIGRSAAGFGALLLALILAGGAAYFPLSMRDAASKVPPIHDITTDTANPPVFVAIAPLRAGAPNGVEYKADENAAKQQEAYPDIQPLVMPDVAPADLFARAEKAARAMNWEIVAAEAAEGRIEATDTTQWWGFKDDVVIRIAAEGNGSRLDIRSMSRVGKSDIGKNAERIRKFLAAVKEAK